MLAVLASSYTSPRFLLRWGRLGCDRRRMAAAATMSWSVVSVGVALSEVSLLMFSERRISTSCGAAIETLARGPWMCLIVMSAIALSPMNNSNDSPSLRVNVSIPLRPFVVLCVPACFRKQAGNTNLKHLAHFIQHRILLLRRNANYTMITVCWIEGICNTTECVGSK
jgi:hypothetical protein